jgi:ferritin-like protein
MAISTISIKVDAEAARAFAEASAEERRKLQLLLSLRLRELTACPARSLKEIMDDIGTRAEALGLTPEILESLLHGEQDSDRH